MASSNSTTSALEKSITKTLSEYIDRAITAPPKHQPFVYYNEYDIFVQNIEDYCAGIDMKQAYEAKYDDPSWVKERDLHSLNVARLFLAVGERDSYAPLPGSSPLISLSSVDLKCVSEKRFEDILFHIANATQRLVSSRPPVDPQTSDRAYEESIKKTFTIDLHQEYQRQSDDPYWMVRYSNMAINVVRLSLAVKAIPPPRNRARPRPPARISLDSVKLKDITQQSFLEHLTGFFLASRRAAERAAALNALNDPGPGTTAPTQHANPVNDQSQDQNQDEAEGEENDYDDAWEDDDEDDDVSDDMGEHLDDPSALDSEDDSLSLFESEEDRNQLFADWCRNEDMESLPIDVMGPLLDDPATKSITVNLLVALLGVAKAPMKKFKNNVQTVLRERRKMYRVAHTRPFLFEQIPEYNRPITPLLHAYSDLALAVYMMRRIPVALVTPEMLIPTMQTAGDLLEDLRCLDADLLPDCRAVIVERNRIARIRLETCMKMFWQSQTIQMIMVDLHPAESSKHMKNYVINPTKASEILMALKDFRKVDEACFGKHYFQVFPGCLVKPFEITAFLRDLVYLKQLSESKNKDFLAAIHIATELLEKWRERSLDTKNSLFAPIRYY